MTHKNVHVLVVYKTVKLRGKIIRKSKLEAYTLVMWKFLWGSSGLKRQEEKQAQRPGAEREQEDEARKQLNQQEDSSVKDYEREVSRYKEQRLYKYQHLEVLREESEEPERLQHGSERLEENQQSESLQQEAADRTEATTQPPQAEPPGPIERVELSITLSFGWKTTRDN